LKARLVTPTVGLKRVGYVSAAAVAALVGAFAAVPFVVQADAVRAAVQAEIRYATGFDPILGGEVSISSFPSTSASFASVTLNGDVEGQPALSAERLTARLRLLPLLVGRIEVADITLTRPQVLVDVDADGRTNWAGLISTLARTLSPDNRSGRMVSFSEIRLADGSVRVRNQARGTTETLDGVELSLAWPSISKSFGATGNFLWRGEKVDASLNVADFVAALTGDRSGIKLRLSGAPLKLAFDGHIGHRPTLKIEGMVAADSPSLRNALMWMGQEPLPGGGFGRFALKAQTSVVGSTVALSSVNVELDGNSAEGVLTFAGDTRPLLQGTLAADEFDATTYLSEIRLLGSNDRTWSRVPIALEGFTTLDFDLRLSASRMLIGGSRFGKTAVSTSLRNGRFAVTVGESQAFGGMLKGSVGLAKSAAGADLKAQLTFTDVDLEACLNAIFGVRKLEGRGNMALTLEASGSDVASITRAITGAGTLTAVQGALTGLNVEQALRRLERRPLSGAGDFRTGRTPFDRLAVSVKVAGGTAKLDSVELEGSSVRLALGGSASIPGRDLDLQGVATLAPAALRDGARGFELPFAVRGRWDDPVMVPDVQALIRRSGAAAPLLDAVRGGQSREAVRSAIDQVTRGAEAPLASAPAVPVEEAPASAAAQ
jgi:AsmA protein